MFFLLKSFRSHVTMQQRWAKFSNAFVHWIIFVPKIMKLCQFVTVTPIVWPLFSGHGVYQLSTTQATTFYNELGFAYRILVTTTAMKLFYRISINLIVNFTHTL